MRLDSKDGFGQFGLAIALHAGDGQYFALGNVEGEIVNSVLAIVVNHGQVPHLESDVADPGRSPSPASG